MRFPIRTFFSLFLVSSLLFIVSSSVQAEGEFETDYSVNYSVDQEGQTNVTQEITLKNKTANYYADKFELKIGSTRVEDVKASDAQGPMEVQVNFANNVTTISVKFNQRVIGFDKTLDWTLTYSSNELAAKSGHIWEVSIPKVAKSADIGQYQVQVNVPTALGAIAFAVPTPKSTKTTRTNQEFFFEKSQLIESGIAMSFGTTQVFTFTLNYYLENTGLTTRLAEIALPPDSNYQKVVIEEITPQPQNVIVDADGNFLAQYKMSPKDKFDIKVEGAVEVFSRPFRNIYQNLTEEQRNHYLQPQRYWEIDNGLIQDKANELKTPKAIYEFTTNFLSYNQERLTQESVERKGAAQAIATPKDAVCTEFTDLFIAIARASGIPAREVEGFAYTQNERLRPLSLALQNGDLLHAWPEYWDDNLGWIQVDPTWGSTSGGLDYFNKMDFNHISFVHRGISSTSPYPAGSYKRPQSKQEKSVFVSFAEELPHSTIIPELDLSVSGKVVSGIPLKVTAIVKNVGTTAILDGILNLESSTFQNNSQNPINLAILPPYSQKNVLYSLTTNGFFNRGTASILLTFADTSVSKTVSIIPIYSLFFSPNFVASLVLAGTVIVIGFALYKKFHNPPNLL